MEADFVPPRDPAFALDDVLFDRYLAGECTPDEAHVVERWLNVSSREAHAARATATALSSARKARFSTDRLLAGLAARIDSANEAAAAKLPARTGWFRRHSRAVAGGVAAGVVAVLVAGLWGDIRDVRLASNTGASGQVYATTTGETKHISLPDGSRIVLAPQSQIIVQRGYNNAERGLMLQGEAFFEVVSSTATPFFVTTGAVITRVLGTSFSIRHYADDSTVRVAVVSGKVNADAGRESKILSAGTVIDVNDSGRIATHPTNASEHVTWLDGKLVFDDAPVPVMLKALSRWYGYEFALADTSLANARVSAVFPTKKPDATMLALSDVLDVSPTIRGDTVVLYHRKHYPPARTPRLPVDHSREIGR